jgi:hypothetical protein
VDSATDLEVTFEQKSDRGPDVVQTSPVGPGKHNEEAIALETAVRTSLDHDARSHCRQEVA